jgi:hypothetical protein
MTNSELRVSYDTVRHLDAWLDRTIMHEHPDEVAAIRERMLTLVADDEDYWTAQGWWNVHDQVEYGHHD